MWGWLRERRTPEAQVAAGWSGVMSLPRVLTLRPDGLLDMEPAPELSALRGAHTHYDNIELSAASSHVLGDVSGDSLEISAEFEPGDATAFGIKLRCSPDNTEYTLVLYDQTNQQLVVDQQHSSLSDSVNRDIQSAALPLAEGERLHLRIFVDHSVVEVFANGHVCITGRIYPTRADSLGVGLFAHNGSVTLISLDVWQMRSIWDTAS